MPSAISPECAPVFVRALIPVLSLALCATGAVAAPPPHPGPLSVLGQAGSGGTSAQAPASTRVLRMVRDLPWGRFKWNPRAPSRLLHVEGFDRVKDTPGDLEPAGGGSNPTSILAPGGTCFGLCLVTATWYSTLQARMASHRQDAGSRALRPSPLVHFGTVCGLGPLVPDPLAEADFESQRLRDVTTGRGQRPVQIAKIASAVHELQAGGAAEDDPALAEAVVELFPAQSEILGRALADLANPMRATHAVTLPGRGGAAGRPIPHAILICGAWEGEAHAETPKGSGTIVRTPAVKLDLYDPNFAPGLKPKADRQYLLYFRDALRFGWPDEPWVEDYIASVGSPTDLRGRKARLFDTDGGLVPDEGIGEYHFHGKHAADFRIRTYQAAVGDPDRYIEARLHGSDPHGLGFWVRQKQRIAGNVESPFIRVHTVDDYIRAEFGIER